ncbi:MAG: hypothetical protein ABEI52_02740, partial [Halobacteriaceae archaeon]
MNRRSYLRQAGLAFGILGAGTAVETRDVEFPATYTPLDILPLAGAKEGVVNAEGRTAYVATTGGFAVIDIDDPRDIRIRSHLETILDDHPEGPLKGIWDISYDDGHVAVAGPANVRPRGALAGVAIYDVSVSSDPVLEWFFEAPWPIHNCDLSRERVLLTAIDGR